MYIYIYIYIHIGNNNSSVVKKGKKVLFLSISEFRVFTRQSFENWS